jgi:hypothetical protein
MGSRPELSIIDHDQSARVVTVPRACGPRRRPVVRRDFDPFLAAAAPPARQQTVANGNRALEILFALRSDGRQGHETGTPAARVVEHVRQAGQSYAWSRPSRCPIHGLISAVTRGPVNFGLGNETKSALRRTQVQ